jgi:ferritin
VSFLTLEKNKSCYQPKISKLLNQQIASEAEASNYYLSMASWAQEHGYNGVSKFLYKHSDEERMHMLKLVHFVNDRGGRSIIPALKSFPGTFKSVRAVFEIILTHEEKVTMQINDIVEACFSEKDYTTHTISCNGTVAEQIEEETPGQNAA